MTAPRLREQRRPPSPPDRRPGPRGGHPSPSTVSAAKRLAGFARLAGAALLALFGALALPATAQAQEIVLVSNFAEGRDSQDTVRSPTYSIFDVELGERRTAQRFTAGPNTAGYVLQSVTLQLSGEDNDAQGVQVAIHENNSSGDPGAQLAVLDNPADPFGVTRTFSAPSPLSLVAGSPYWVVVSNTATTNSAFYVSITESSDQTTTQGFSIRDTRHQGTPGSWSEATDYAVRMEVRGTVAIPSADATLSDLVVNDGNTNLTLTPAFASDKYTYRASVTNDVAEVTVTAMTTDSGATIEYLDGDDATLTDADTSDPGHQVALAVGNYVIQVKVTAADGNTTATYMVTVNRAVDAVVPVVTIAADKTLVWDFEGTAGFTLSRTGPTAATLTVTVEVTQEVDRDLLPDGAEAERTVTFAVNSATTALSVALENDDLSELAGDLTVEVQAGSGYTVGDPASATVEVRDGDEGNPQPANLMAEAGAGVGEVALSWDAHAPHLTFYRHQYRYKTDGNYAAWTDIPNSGQHTIGDGSNLTGYTVTGLVGGQVHTFQVRTHHLKPDGITLVVSDSSNEATATPRSAADADAPGVEGDLRLTDEESYTHPDGYEGVSGRAEIFHAGRWGTVSSDGFSRDTTSRFIEDLDTNGDPLGTYTYGDVANNAPALFCQAMSYDTGEYASGYGRPGVPSQRSESEMPYYPVGSTYPSDGPEPIWVDDMTCAAGDADLTVGALPVPMAHCGYAGWGLHNSNHGEDAGVRCWNEPESDAGRSYDPLTAAFEGVPATHDGETAFSFRLAFSEAVAVTPEAMRTRALTVAGGAVTGAARVDGESGVWEITVTPDSREDLSITLARTEECAADGAVCTSDGRTLSAVPAHIVPGPGPETEPALTAELQGLPEVHDGEDTFHFRVAFSENIGIGFRSMRDDSFTVDGGEVIAARRVEGRHDLWQITVEPDSDGDVAIALPGGRECAVSGAICTRGENRRQLANTPTATVPGPSDDAPEPNTAATGAPTISGTPQVGEALTASTSGISDADGLDDARFAYQWIRTGTDIGGATGATYTPVAADEGTRLKVRVLFTDDAGNEERLTSAATDAVAAATEPLTASFSGVPGEHTGRSFTFGLRFSEDFPLSYKTLRDAAFSVNGGEVRGAKRKQQGSNQRWTITVEPDSHAAVTVTLPARGGRDLGRPQPPERRVGDRGRSGRDLGGRCAGGRRRRGTVGLRGHARPGSDGHGDGRLRHHGQHGDGGCGLHGHERHAHLPGGRPIADGQRDGARRLARRGRGDPDADVVERLGRSADGRQGDRNDREHRPDAAGVYGALWPDGGGARHRAGAGTDQGAARGGLRGPICRAATAAWHGARVGGRVPQPVCSLGRGESGRGGCSRSHGRLSGSRRQFARDTGSG